MKKGKLFEVLKHNLLSVFVMVLVFSVISVIAVTTGVNESTSNSTLLNGSLDNSSVPVSEPVSGGGSSAPKTSGASSPSGGGSLLLTEPMTQGAQSMQNVSLRKVVGWLNPLISVFPSPNVSASKTMPIRVFFIEVVDYGTNRVLQLLSNSSSAQNDSAIVHTQIGVDGADSFFQIGGGNLGIGTDAPASALDVVGNASISDNLNVGGNLSVGGNINVQGNVVVDGCLIYDNAGVPTTLGNCV